MSEREVKVTGLDHEGNERIEVLRVEPAKTLRDEFALAIVRHNGSPMRQNQGGVARQVYEYVDALMAARKGGGDD